MHRLFSSLLSLVTLLIWGFWYLSGSPCNLLIHPWPNECRKPQEWKILYDPQPCGIVSQLGNNVYRYYQNGLCPSQRITIFSFTRMILNLKYLCLFWFNKEKNTTQYKNKSVAMLKTLKKIPEKILKTNIRKIMKWKNIKANFTGRTIKWLIFEKYYFDTFLMVMSK